LIADCNWRRWRWPEGVAGRRRLADGRRDAPETPAGGWRVLDRGVRAHRDERRALG
jgi:hypothetical protein